MAELPFSLELVRFLADHRHALLTPLFQLFTFLGEIEGYVLLVALVYVAWDKALAFRLAVLTLVAMSLNHALKMGIANPRPFLTEGTWPERWAVAPARAADLATEFSTPSGHAMAGSAFYAYLYASVASAPVRAACVALVLLTGLSRPYLGVHYLEDVLLGWLLGGALALLALRHAAGIRSLWDRLSLSQQSALAVAASGLAWLATRVLAGGTAEGDPTAFVSYAGFLTGLVAVHPVEARTVRFDPRSSSLARKALRYALAVGLVLGTLELLDVAFAALAADATPLGDLLRYLRYAAAGVVAMLVAPFLFVKLGWGDRLPEAAPPGPPPAPSF